MRDSIRNNLECCIRNLGCWLRGCFKPQTDPSLPEIGVGVSVMSTHTLQVASKNLVQAMKIAGFPHISFRLRIGFLDIFRVSHSVLMCCEEDLGFSSVYYKDFDGDDEAYEREEIVSRIFQYLSDLDKEERLDEADDASADAERYSDGTYSSYVEPREFDSQEIDAFLRMPLPLGVMPEYDEI